jgi:arylsulfatase A-like enzyme
MRCRWTLAALPALAGSLGCSQGPAAPPRPDLVLVSVDTLRADRLGCYGNRRDTSPFLDRLAAEGVRAAFAWAPTSWTLPSHLTLLTGLDISVHGVDDDRLWSLARLPEGPTAVPLRGVFLPEVLADAGYATAGFYRWKYLAPEYGFGPGFDVYRRVGAAAEAGADPAASVDLHRPQDQFAVDAALEWFAARSEEARPLALFLHLFDVHEDYLPPQPFDRAFTDPDYHGPIDGRQVSGPASKVTGDLRREDLRQLLALYDGEVAWVDSQLARLERGLSELGRGEALWMVTADHGEEFFEHGAKSHRTQLFRESLHVPWIARWPGELPAGLEIGGDVGLVDLAPTIYGLLGLPAPPGLSGTDLAAIFRGRAPNGVRSYPALLLRFGETFAPTRVRALRRGDRTWIEEFADDGAPRRYVFDRRADPFEFGDGAPAEDEWPAEELQALWQTVRLGYLEQRARQPLRASSGRLPTETERAELEALGYAAPPAPRSATLTGGRRPLGGTDEPLPLDGGFWPAPGSLGGR